jgi:photosystem II stability/assembly factor-like uncharacterized protein
MKTTKTLATVTLGLGLALSIAACGTTIAADGGAPAVGLTTLAPPIDAALVTHDFGWVLTEQKLLLTHDSGATFTSVTAPVPASPVRAAYFPDAANGTVAAAAGDTVSVAITHDGGATWQSSVLRNPSASPAGYSALSLSLSDTGNGALVARTATSQAFSQGTLFATTDGGRSWSAHPAPEAGSVSVEPDGQIWLAGAALNVTSDQGKHWTRAELDLAGSPGSGSATLSTPVAGQLPVTVTTGEATRVLLLSSSDKGRTWRIGSSVPVRGRTGVGVRVAVADTSAGPVVFDNAGTHAYIAANGVDLHPSGLVEGVYRVTFDAQGTAGWALATYGTCASGKRDCVLHDEILKTVDSGATWQRLGAWTRALE